MPKKSPNPELDLTDYQRANLEAIRDYFGRRNGELDFEKWIEDLSDMLGEKRADYNDPEPEEDDQ